MLSNLCQINPNIKKLNICNKWPVRNFTEKSQLLYLNFPHITSLGAISLAEGIGRGSSLVSLHLSDQRIGM
jgi:hypothetical protein